MTTQVSLFEKENRFDQFNQKFDQIVNQICDFASNCTHHDREHCFQCFLYVISVSDNE